MTQSGDDIDVFLGEFNRFKIDSSTQRNAYFEGDSTPRYPQDAYSGPGYGAGTAYSSYDEGLDPTYDPGVEQAVSVSKTSRYGPSAASGSSSRASYQHSFYSAASAAGTRRTTPPPSRGTGTTTVEWMQGEPMPALVESPYHPCEFCDSLFDVSATQEWVQHVTKKHLRGRLPPRANCVFCPEEFEASSRSDRKANFQRRMLHIRSHFNESWYGDEAKAFMSPDWYLITYLQEEGLLKKVETTQLLNEFVKKPEGLGPRGSSSRTSGSRRSQPAVVESARSHRRSRN